MRRDQSRNVGLFKSPTLRLQHSRSQRRSATHDERTRPKHPLSRSKSVSTPIDIDGSAVADEGPEGLPNQVTRPDVAGSDQGHDAPTTATIMSSFPNPLKQRLSELHAKYPHLKSLPNPLLPIVAFPGQGSGRASEFAQEAPVWSRQPYKIMYFVYFGISVGLVFLPWFALVSLFPSKRERPSWTWKKSTLVKLYRHGTRLTFRTYTSLSRDLAKEVPHSQTVRAKFVWVEGLPAELVRGELKRGLEIQGLSTVRTCGFWYGERDGGGGVGQKAAPGEKVVYHLHGGAYWIGTAHEKDVTSAVNVQILKALSRIYSIRMPSKHDDAHAKLQAGQPSPHPPLGGPGAGHGGLCKRAFSLDYRLCVPGRPEVGSFPAPLADAVAGYRYLVRDCEFDTKNIIVAGDSAGGNLALALCRYLRDERIEGMPGAMLLLSPWADTSRSHSGPTSAPNVFSSVHLNRKSDIIAPSLAFRNTAVSALLGKMPARETYKNPYLSSISLQLPAKDGGAGPHWGFEGFPRRIYVCTGTAEISHDQHITLAYRLAGGTRMRVPIHSGDRCHKDADPYEMAARLQYPRPEDHEITMWPSVQNTPAAMSFTPNDVQGTPAELVLTPGGIQRDSQPLYSGTSRNQSQSNGAWLNDHDEIDEPSKNDGKGIISAARDTAAGALDAVGLRLKGADGYIPNTPGVHSHAANSNGASRNASRGTSRHGGSQSPEEVEAGEGPKTVEVKEKDTASNPLATHKQARQNSDKQHPAKTPVSSKKESPNGRASIHNDEDAEKHATTSTDLKSNAVQGTDATQHDYFDLGGEERTVVLDECVDAIHDYTLCE